MICFSFMQSSDQKFFNRKLVDLKIPYAVMYKIDLVHSKEREIGLKEDSV